jgi:hypothetical protein
MKPYETCDSSHLIRTHQIWKNYENQTLKKSNVKEEIKKNIQSQKKIKNIK